MNARRNKIASKIELEVRLAEANWLLRQLEQRDELIRDMATELNSTYQSAPRAIAQRPNLVLPAVTTRAGT